MAGRGSGPRPLRDTPSRGPCSPFLSKGPDVVHWFSISLQREDEVPSQPLLVLSMTVRRAGSLVTLTLLVPVTGTGTCVSSLGHAPGGFSSRNLGSLSFGG